MRSLAWVVVLGLFGAPAHAETVYVTERLATALRATFADDSSVVKALEAGAQLEVVERVDKFVHVRDAQGADGWIEARFLVNTPPARAQLERSQAELAKLRKELADARGRIGELEATLAQPGPSATESAPVVVPPSPASTQSTPVSTNGGFAWGWLVLAFAMLWLGFGTGVVWVRERYRKRLGGMYLRI
jgi:hypothetical protein